MKLTLAPMLLLLAVTSAGAARAADLAPAADDTCLTYNHAYADAPLMQVAAAPGGRVFLQDKPQTCPAQGPCGWRRKAYLTNGDPVLVSAPRKGFRCAYFGAAGAKLIAGFLPVTALKPLPDPPLDPKALVGRWREDGGNVLTVAQGPKGLQLSGAAKYEQEQARASGALRPTRDGFTVKDGECLLTARARGPYLKVDDNNGCGAMNAHFNGLYMKLR